MTTQPEPSTPIATQPTSTVAVTGAPSEDDQACDDFKKLPAFERIKAAGNSEAPAGPTCAKLVDAANEAYVVYQATVSLDSADVTSAIGGLVCEPDRMTAKLTNDQDFPIVLWGFGRGNDENGTTLWFTPFVTEPVPAKTTVDLELKRPASGGAHVGCNIGGDWIVAPIDSLAADGTIGQIADDDPQGSDDINVWFPAVQAKESELRSTPSRETAAHSTCPMLRTSTAPTCWRTTTNPNHPAKRI